MNTFRRFGEEEVRAAVDRGHRLASERKVDDDTEGPDVTAVTGAETARESDAEIIRRSLGDPEWFGAVFDRYYVEIHGYATRRLGHTHADDVAANTFLLAFSRRDRYDLSRSDARPWLYGIASNLISRHHRAEQRYYRALARTGVTPVGEGHADRVADRTDALARRAPLAAALARLSKRDRDVLLLVAWAELTSEQAGQALGIPAGTARSRLHRARKQLRAAITRLDHPTTP